MEDKEDKYNYADIIDTTPISMENGKLFVSFAVGLGYEFRHKHIITVEIKGADFLEWFDSHKIAEIREGVKNYIDSK